MQFPLSLSTRPLLPLVQALMETATLNLIVVLGTLALFAAAYFWFASIQG